MLAFDTRAAKIAWSVSLVGLALFAIYSVRRSLLVFVLAVFFSYLLYPAVRRLEGLMPKRVSRTVSTAVVYILLLLILVGLLSLIGPQIAEQASRLAERLPALIRDPTVIDRVPLPEWLTPYRARIGEFAREQLQSGTAYALPLARQAGQLALGLASNILFVVLIPILSFLFIMEGATMRDRFLAWTADRGTFSMWRRIVDDLDGLLGRYIRALLILAVATLGSYAAFFTIVGVPYGLLLAVIAGVLEFIPVIGPLVAAITLVVVAVLSDYSNVLWLVGFIAVYRLLQDYVLNPMLMSGGVAVPPLLVLFGLLAGEELAGVAGIFLSVPVLAAAKIAVLRISQELKRRDAAELRSSVDVAAQVVPSRAIILDT